MKIIGDITDDHNDFIVGEKCSVTVSLSVKVLRIIHKKDKYYAIVHYKNKKIKK